MNRVTGQETMLREALKWALQGNHVTSHGFATKGCGCCSYSAEPPAEIDAIVREVRRELLPDDPVNTCERQRVTTAEVPKRSEGHADVAARTGRPLSGTVELCGAESAVGSAPADQQSAVPYGHSMLPNDSHPGPGCSCRECLRAHP